jgi:hypothetical protein
MGKGDPGGQHKVGVTATSADIHNLPFREWRASPAHVRFAVAIG